MRLMTGKLQKVNISGNDRKYRKRSDSDEDDNVVDCDNDIDDDSDDIMISMTLTNITKKLMITPTIIDDGGDDE